VQLAACATKMASSAVTFLICVPQHAASRLMDELAMMTGPTSRWETRSNTRQNFGVGVLIEIVAWSAAPRPYATKKF